MSQDIRDFLTPSCALLGLGEPTHREPAFTRVRNELFAQLVACGFRSITLETHRVAGLAVDEYIGGGEGSVEAVLSDGLSHGFGALEGNRDLVEWLREHNQDRPPADRVTFHGFDIETENTTAPSPRAYLEHARDYLGLDLDIAGLAGDDHRWSREEAILDPARSPGDTPEAERLRVLADDLLATLLARAPDLVAATSRAAWLRAKTHLTAGIGLLRYHRQSACPGDAHTRMTRLISARDGLMAQNLLDIRAIEARRGPTLVFAHNLHLQRSTSTIQQSDSRWNSAGAIVASVSSEPYTFIAGSLGRSTAAGLSEPEPDTYEGRLQSRFDGWGLTAADLPPAEPRAATHGYFPLDRSLLGAADAILHINGA
ncbi:erythromycin esterase family protein [Actinokineospora sp. NPDC004072]